MTDEEKIADYLLHENDPIYEFPPEFEQDREKLRIYLGSTICGYLALVGKLYQLIRDDFPHLNRYGECAEKTVSAAEKTESNVKTI